MKKVCLILVFFGHCVYGTAQSVAERLATTTRDLEKDEQMQAAILAIYVVDLSSGKPVFERNSNTGLAPASTQKIFTAAAAFELLGQAFRYNTSINLYKTSAGKGVIELAGSGDPSLGSPRFAVTKKEKLLQDWTKNISAMSEKLRWSSIFIRDMPVGDLLSIPEGYIWQDIGNYYGAGSTLLNWNENQYDLVLSTGPTGSAAAIKSVSPAQQQLIFRNSVKAGQPGTGDNAYIFAAPFAREAFVKGTVPPNQESFTISGAMPDPGFSAGTALAEVLRKAELLHKPPLQSELTVTTSRNMDPSVVIGRDAVLLNSFQHSSPPLDSLVYWFLRKSINLYGEAFVKTIALQNKKNYETEPGLELLRTFWKSKGIASAHLGMKDGSGLSPLNRVTAKSLVQVLQYSLERTWYPAFYLALPEYNGMKMKSGSIEGARAFTGYHKSKDGKNYAFAILVNNYTGSSTAIVRKIYGVLDCLK